MELSNTQKRILIYSLALFGITELLEQAYPVTNISNASDFELFINSVIITINHFSLAVALSGMIILGIRLIRKRGLTLKTALMPCFSFLFILFVIYLYVFPYSVLNEMGEILESNPHYVNLLAALNESLERKDLSPDKRAFISKDYARIKYETEGLIFDYVNPEGTLLTYKPTVEEVSKRENMLKFQIESMVWNRINKKSIMNALIFWPLLTLSSILIGLFSSIKEIESY
jgi:hypothetical protein